MPSPAGPKSAGAFRTISEVSAQTGVPQHILRYWETRFPQLRPVTRAGNRRYYRPEDVTLVERIDRLLNREGYTIKGAQAVIAGSGAVPVPSETPAPPPAPALTALRDLLARALDADRG